uniref:BED-type domain-containing protein n=1 Tax=Acrobeloides nanus TaxID=290746 RepID=A0A914EFM6_9BILA
MYVAVEDLLWLDMLAVNLRSYKTASLSHSSVGNGLLAISAQASNKNSILSPNSVTCSLSVKSPIALDPTKSPRSPRGSVLTDYTPTPTPTDILSRFERGRALRKSAAIEDEDQPVFNEGSYGLTNPDGNPNQQQQHAAALAAAAAANLRAAVASSIATTAGTALGPHTGGLPLQQTLSPETAAVAAAALASMQSRGFKQEPLSKEELLSLVSNNAPDLLAVNPWMNLGAPVNALASLSALIQNSESGTSIGTGLCNNPTNLSEELRISTDDRKMFDSSKFMDMRNHSTESNASTSSAPALGSNNESIPRKSVIQEDIRLNKGRFSLVRKRGRSEVWNLFGQVVDNLTSQRLPFVACYACKVLYTDTGGGTGNMTRHRCPIGSSYRSFTGSSVDTVDMINTQSSFESVNMTMPFSPENENQESQQGTVIPSTTAAQSREAFRESGSQHPSLSSCGLASASTHFSTSTESAPLSALLPSSSTSTALAITPHSGGASSLTGVQPTGGSAFTPTSSIGYAFTPSDKELFAQALVKFIAEDLHSCKIVETEAFARLIESALFIGRRCMLTSVPTATDTLKNLIPSSRQLKEIFDTHLHYAKNATAMDLSTLKDLGISLIAQQIDYNGEEFFSIWSSYISDDWRAHRRCLSVEQKSENFEDFVMRSLATYGLTDANKIRLTMDNDFEEVNLANFPENINVVDNVNHAIDKILKEVFIECTQIDTVQQILRLFLKITHELIKMGALEHLSRPKVLPSKLMSATPGTIDELNFSNDIYCLLKFVRENHNKIINVLQAQNVEENKELASGLGHVDWTLVSDMELFLEPFYETTQIFNNSKQPHFHRIFPEWYALIHECKASDEDEEDEVYNHAQPSELTQTPQTSEKHHPSSWLKSLRRSAEQKLKDWASEHIRIEHQVATVLNPRLKHLPVICTDVQRFQVYGQIREITGLSKEKMEKSSEQSDGEPTKKRRRFLSQLEDTAIEDDELECYLRTPFAPQQTKDILEFWSTVGESQFPRLAKLARFILSMAGAAAPIELSNPSSSRLTVENLNGLLMLRSVYGL